MKSADGHNEWAAQRETWVAGLGSPCDSRPEVVSCEDNGKDARGIDYARLTAVLVEAVKQQQTEIQQEKLQIRRLEAEVRRLEASKADAVTSVAKPANSAAGKVGRSRAGHGQSHPDRPWRFFTTTNLSPVGAAREPPPFPIIILCDNLPGIVTLREVRSWM
jgi:hypothetical protein